MPRDVLGLEPMPVVRLVKINMGALWNDSGRINGFVAVIIVRFNVLQIYSLTYSRLLVKISHVIREIGVVSDPLLVGFKMTKIDCIKANKCCKKPPIGFGLI